MAKRKRLSPAILAPDTRADTKAETGPNTDIQTAPVSRPPIAHVAGIAAEQAGLAEVAQALTEAREEGRLIQKLPLAEIETRHLVRDRIAFDAADMTALESSLAARGQQVPVEVVARAEGGYGLISGLRRVIALRNLGATEVLALIRQPENSADAYLAMVEENEIRAGISFYERARLAAEAAKLGLYPSAAAAISALFGAASPAKRSKIGSFVRVHDALGDVLSFPAAIPERLGLALAGALETAGFASHLRARLAAETVPDAAAERAVLEAALTSGEKGSDPQNRAAQAEIAPGIQLSAKSGRAVLTGPGVTPDLLAALQAWLAER